MGKNYKIGKTSAEKRIFALFLFWKILWYTKRRINTSEEENVGR